MNYIPFKPIVCKITALVILASLIIAEYPGIPHADMFLASPSAYGSIFNENFKNHYLPQIAPDYARLFMSTFIPELYTIMSTSKTRQDYLKDIIEMFDGLRKSQEDLWLQPYLMLDRDKALVIFKDGPNSIHFGSRPIAYRIYFNQTNAEYFSSIKDIDAILKKLFVPYEVYKEEFDTKERLAIGGRSTDHSIYMNLHDALMEVNQRLTVMIVILTQKGAYEEELQFLKAIKKRITYCCGVGSKLFNYSLKLHKMCKVLCAEAQELKIEDIEKVEQELVSILHEFKAQEALFKNLVEQMPEIGDKLNSLSIVLIQSAGIMQAITDLVLGRSCDSVEPMNCFQFLESVFTIVRRCSMAGRTAAEREPFYIPSNKFTIKPFWEEMPEIQVSIENDIEQLKKIMIQGNYRAFAFSLENAVMGALRASKKSMHSIDLNISCKKHDEKYFLEVTIKDFASGIPAQDLFKISDPDFTTKARETGWAFARRAIFDAGGTVSIDSLTADDETYKGKRKNIGPGTDVFMQWPIKKGTVPFLIVDKSM